MFRSLSMQLNILPVSLSMAVEFLTKCILILGYIKNKVKMSHLLSLLIYHFFHPVVLFAMGHQIDFHPFFVLFKVDLTNP